MTNPESFPPELLVPEFRMARQPRCGYCGYFFSTEEELSHHWSLPDGAPCACRVLHPEPRDRWLAFLTSLSSKNQPTSPLEDFLSNHHDLFQTISKQINLRTTFSLSCVSSSLYLLVWKSTNEFRFCMQGYVHPGTSSLATQFLNRVPSQLQSLFLLCHHVETEALQAIASQINLKTLTLIFTSFGHSSWDKTRYPFVPLHEDPGNDESRDPFHSYSTVQKVPIPEYLTGLTSLTALQLRHQNPRRNDIDIRSLSSLQRLKHLHLQCSANFYHLSFLPMLRNLNSLILENLYQPLSYDDDEAADESISAFLDDHMSTLSTLPLTRLDLKRCALSPQCLSQLNVPSLTRLYLSSIQLDDIAIGQLSSLQHLTRLTLSKMSQLRTPSLSALTNLSVLKLDDCPSIFTYEEELDKLPLLTKLVCTNMAFRSFTATTIQSLTLARCTHVSSYGSCPRLSHLRMFSCACIGIPEVKELPELKTLVYSFPVRPISGFLPVFCKELNKLTKWESVCFPPPTPDQPNMLTPEQIQLLSILIDSKINLKFDE